MGEIESAAELVDWYSIDLHQVEIGIPAAQEKAGDARPCIPIG